MPVVDRICVVIYEAVGYLERRWRYLTRRNG